jgi:hypothetical protein
MHSDDSCFVREETRATGAPARGARREASIGWFIKKMKILPNGIRLRSMPETRHLDGMSGRSALGAGRQEIG